MVAGIDWASELHLCCVIDATGRVVERFEVTHDAAALRGMTARLRRAGVDGVAIERGDGSGQHVTDFRRDQAMSALASPRLPIPEVIAVGRVVGSANHYYCVSSRAVGDPLEDCAASDWPAIAEQVAAALEAMRALTPTPTTAASAGTAASVAPWRQQLLDIERGDLDPRGAGWPAKLATSKTGSAGFTAGIDHLRRLHLGDVPLTLLHGDLLNRNVHIDADRITGIFDWGCQRWGDHLYDLAWFDFWSPWYPNLDVNVLRAAISVRWAAAQYVPVGETNRLRACLIYIGLEDLIYSATIDRWDELDHVVTRMKTLDLI